MSLRTARNLVARRGLHLIRRACIALLFALPITASAASAASPASTATRVLHAGDEPTVTTEQHITLAGKQLDYITETGRLAIRDVATGKAVAQMFYTAYRVPSKTPRPLAFVWNGGPGAASDTLHFNVAGPMRIDGSRLVTNAQTWLTDMDLVFVDPIGTGFSRVLDGNDASRFYGTVGDVDSVAEFVRAWKLRHDAEDVPTLLIGESWGANRAGSVGYRLLKHGVRVDALALISGGTGLQLDDATRHDLDAWRVVNLVASARFHHKGDQHGSLSDAQHAAAQWVQQRYLPALHRIDKLSASERDAIARSLSGFTGMDAASIDRKTLRISPKQYRSQLMGKDHPLDLFDLRLDHEPPALAAKAELAYLRQTLGYRTDLPYIGIEDWADGFSLDGKTPASVGAQWNYATAEVTPEQVAAAIKKAIADGGGPPQLGKPLPSTAEAIALNPQLKVLVASGLYDSMANCAGYDVLDHELPKPQHEAINFACYPGGHMMYRDDDVRKQFSDDIRALANSLH